MTAFCGIKKDLQEYWNTQGSIYDFCYESEEECLYWQERLKGIIGSNPREILDVGTGTGFLARNLSALGHQVTGLDFSTDMMSQARTKMKTLGLSWELVLGDAEDPDFPDNSFDVVICRYLLWTLPHPDDAITQWVRLLRPGGLLIVIDGKRKKRRDTLPTRVNRLLWTASRRICKGYSGIQGHNLDIEKDLPYFEGIDADEILGYFSRHPLTGCTVTNLDAFPEIVSRNLPWFVRFGYRSSGIPQIVSGKKEESL